MSYLSKEEDSHPRHKESRNVENALVLQGGGSFGAVNAAIIVGSNSDHPEKDLENFWIEVAESSPNIIPDIFVFDYDSNAKKYISKKISAASANAAMFGVPKMFTPVWSRWLPWSHDEDDNNKIYDRNKRDRR